MTQPRIALDARMMKHSGIGTYLSHLVAEYALKFPRDLKLDLLASSAVLASSKILKDPTATTKFGTKPFGASIYGLVEQINYVRYSAGYDIWHAPHYNLPIFSLAKHLIVTIHDVTPYLFAGRFFSRTKALYIQAMMARARKKAARIIAVSNSTAKDLSQHFNIPEKKITVIHEGVDLEFFDRVSQEQMSIIRARYKLPQQYILFVGNLKPHKNLGCLLDAWKEMRKSDAGCPDLVLVGKKDDYYPPSMRYLQNLESGGGIHYLAGIEYGDLAAIYQGAQIYVQPSLYEGFGLPVLEAMASRVAVIASDRGSLPEVAGNAALIFPAEDSLALQEALVKLLADADLREAKIQQGLSRAREFSWSQMAEKTCAVYQETLAGGGLA